MLVWINNLAEIFSGRSRPQEYNGSSTDTWNESTQANVIGAENITFRSKSVYTLPIPFLHLILAIATPRPPTVFVDSFGEGGTTACINDYVHYGSWKFGRLFKMLHGVSSFRCSHVSGGVMKGEGKTLDSWRAKLREQLPIEPDVGKDNITVQRSTSTQGNQPAGSNAAAAGGTSRPEEEEAQLSLQVQVAPSS